MSFDTLAELLGIACFWFGLNSCISNGVADGENWGCYEASFKANTRYSNPILELLALGKVRLGLGYIRLWLG